jgi:hypothetical protein
VDIRARRSLRLYGHECWHRQQDPADPNYPTLLSVPTKFLAHFNNHQPSHGYKKFDPPIAVDLTGSVFFDVDHPAGAIGPAGLKPSSAWEIHP